MIGKIYYGKYVTLENCKNKGEVKGSGRSGGLVGVLGDGSVANSTVQINNCSNEAEITGQGGGLVSAVQYRNSVTISNCYNKGIIHGGTYTAGLIGQFYSVNTQTIENSYNTGDVFTSATYVGGIIGRATGDCTVTACYNTGNIEATQSCGGIVGQPESCQKITIQNCYNKGDINSTGAGTGGILGRSFNSFEISKCYNTGNISPLNEETGSSVGGILGYASSSSSDGIHNCFNCGMINFKAYYSGSIVGDGYVSISDNYYLKGTSENGGASYVKEPANEIETLDAMKSKMKEILTGTTWKEGSDGFPILSYQNEIAN